MTCYYEAIDIQIAKNKSNYLHPEEFKWIRDHGGLGMVEYCTESLCNHWPLTTVVEGNPHPAYSGGTETYLGFRSEPRPLMGKMILYNKDGILEECVGPFDPERFLTYTPDVRNKREVNKEIKYRDTPGINISIVRE